MKERNITISLEKAKEWYKQGGDLREIALQAFTEDELMDELPTSWKDYLLLKVNKDELINAGYTLGSGGYCYFSTEEEAEAFVALGKLIQLRDKYWELDCNWKPDWHQSSLKFCIYPLGNSIISSSTRGERHILAFRTSALKDKFYENFKDLIEQAKMFL